MKKILIPIDFREASERALRYIRTVFKNQPVELQLINVAFSKGELIDDEVRVEFQKFEQEILKDYPLPYRFSIAHGDLLDEIQKAIHQYEPSLVIMGTSGASLTKAFVKLTDCPVMIIPHNSRKLKIKNIAYANDFQNIKVSSALEPLMDLSQSFDAKVHIIHINKDGNTSTDNAEVSLEYYLQLVDHEYASIRSNDLVKAIQNYVSDQKIDVLSILLRDHGQNNLSSNGKLIEELVSKTDIPMLSLV